MYNRRLQLDHEQISIYYLDFFKTFLIHLTIDKHDIYHN